MEVKKGDFQMISLNVLLKEENKLPEVIFSRTEDGSKIADIRSAVIEKFSNDIIDGGPEKQPYIYITPVPIKKGNSKTAANIVPSDVSFKIEVQEQVVKFIKEYI